ncbi:MAG: type II secretion system GspH family protein [Planctomycetes bacterium]|nr:type II secretion system GspH family protein [Planctomycetota bacterium]
MRSRPGLTLTEVLVTLAILAFGILGILTMFPLAASQMAIAVREDRSAQAANAADSYMRAYWKTEVVEVIKSGGTPEAFYKALEDPNTDPITGAPLPLLQRHPGALVASLLGGGTSSPVFVDPIGFAARSGTTRGWVGDGGGTNAPRRTLKPFFTDSQYAFRTCSLMDGMGYDDNGHPTPNRELRYNWMWVLQRPQINDKFTANMTVVVYDNRPNMFAPTGVEGWFTIVGVALPGSSSLSLSFNSGVSPDVKPGMWIVDVSDPALDILTLPPAVKIPQANFYQVVSTAPAGLSLNLELNNPLKNDPGILLGVTVRKFVVLKGVTGVYPRPPLTAN